jgi:hypothetical protein
LFFELKEHGNLSITGTRSPGSGDKPERG